MSGGDGMLPQLPVRTSTSVGKWGILTDYYHERPTQDI